jgi:polyhydroxyalkanoate synthesis regulator phasin
VNRALQKYLEAASGLTNLTAAKAERIAKGLVRSGEGATDQVGDLVEDLLERSKRNREAITALVKSETTRAVRAMGLATGKQVERLQKQVVDLKRELRRVEDATGTEEAREAPSDAGRQAAPAKKSAAKKATAKKASAKKASAKKATAKKATAKKASAKKASAKKASAKKATAKKATAKKATAKKATAKKATAKKATAKKATAKKATAKKATTKKATAKKATAEREPETPVVEASLEEATKQAAERVSDAAPATDTGTDTGDARLLAADDGPPPEASPVLAEELRDLTEGS